jgi:hypothetical protein
MEMKTQVHTKVCTANVELFRVDDLFAKPPIFKYDLQEHFDSELLQSTRRFTLTYTHKTSKRQLTIITDALQLFQQ